MTDSTRAPGRSEPAPSAGRAPGRRAALAAWLGAVLAMPDARAVSVALQGTMGNKALLLIDGGAPRLLAPGQSHGGVTLVSLHGDAAVVQVGGQRRTLRVGEAPAVVAGTQGPARGDRIVLTVDRGGHFFASGAINGQAVHFMVDTGATAVGIGQSDAQRLGLRLADAQRVRIGTANGVVLGWAVALDSVRVGDVEVRGVQAVVTPQPMAHVLLGNSFLGRFRLQRDNDQLVLERRF